MKAMQENLSCNTNKKSVYCIFELDIFTNLAY